MEIHINYKKELENSLMEKIKFVQDEFIILFSSKSYYTEEDHELAIDLLNQLSRLVDTPQCLDYLAKTLEILEENFPSLF